MIAREYLRVSQDRDGRSTSVAEQHEENAKAVERQGWSLHAQPYEDAGISASRYAKKARGGYAQLVADLESGTFGADVLVLWESSRGSRKVGEWVDLIELLARRGIRLFVTTHGHVYDPAQARDRRGLLEDAVDSEYESAKSSARIRRAVAARAERGGVHGKNLYGYERVYDSRTKQLVEIREHPEQGPVVREILSRALAGDTYYAIAKDLNARNVPPRRPKIKGYNGAKGWTPVAVKEVCEKPAYAGIRRHEHVVDGAKVVEDHEASWPALVDRDEWDRLQEIVRATSAKRPKTNDWPAKHLLAGIAQCAVCGSPMRVGKQNRKSKYVYLTYVCQGTPGRGGFHCSVRETLLDEYVVETMLLRMERPDFLDLTAAADTAVDDERVKLRAEIARIQAYLESVRAQAAETLDLGLLADQERRLRPKIEAAQKRLEALAGVDPAVLDLARSGNVRERWEQLGIPEKRHILRAVVAPIVSPLPPEKRGRRGLDGERIAFAWR